MPSGKRIQNHTKKNPALSYLKAYTQKSKPYLETFLDQKISEAGEISKIPAELVRRFKDMSLRGKHLRGALVVLGYEASGKQANDAIFETSIFLELFQTGILIQDDVMDQDDTRRDLKTIHKQLEELGSALQIYGSPLHFGESLATCLGDIAFYYAWEKLLTSPFPKAAVLEASRLYYEYAIRLVHGQVLDVTNASVQTVSEHDVAKVIQLKTAEYTGALPLLTGFALAQNKDSKQREALKAYGMNLGYAFQIQDDILGVFGDEETGKRTGSDIREGKNTLMMLHFRKHAKPSSKKAMKNIFGKGTLTAEDLETAKELLIKSGSRQYAEKLGHKYTSEGRGVIPNITKDKKQQEIFRSLIDYIMERTK